MPTIGADADARAADRLGDAVIELVHAWREMDRRSPELNQSALAILEMARLIGEGEHRMSEIAERRGVDQSVISRQIGDLQRKHLVCRRPDPTDGRASLVRLTPKGLQVLENVQNLRTQWLRDALARSPLADVEAAAALVSALAEELRAHGPELTKLATPG